MSGSLPVMQCSAPLAAAPEGQRASYAAPLLSLLTALKLQPAVQELAIHPELCGSGRQAAPRRWWERWCTASNTLRTLRLDGDPIARQAPAARSAVSPAAGQVARLSQLRSLHRPRGAAALKAGTWACLLAHLPQLETAPGRAGRAACSSKAHWRALPTKLSHAAHALLQRAAFDGRVSRGMWSGVEYAAAWAWARRHAAAWAWARRHADHV